MNIRDALILTGCDSIEAMASKAVLATMAVDELERIREQAEGIRDTNGESVKTALAALRINHKKQGSALKLLKRTVIERDRTIIRLLNA